MSDIEYIFHIEKALFREIKRDIGRTDKEKKKEESELRPWFIEVVNFTKNIWAGIKKDKLYIYILDVIQVMLAIFAAVSTAGFAVYSLGIFGVHGLVQAGFVLGIAVMSTLSNVFTVAHKICFGSEGNIKFCYQKMRMVEIKLFRSPYMPDPIDKKTEAIKQYMHYYNYEKWVFSEIRKIQEVGYSLDRKKLESIPSDLRVLLLFAMYSRISASPDLNQRRIFRDIAKKYEEIYKLVDQASSRESHSGLLSTLYDKAISSAVAVDESGFNFKGDEYVNDEDKVSQMIAIYSVKRFAYFARVHIEEQDKYLVEQANESWLSLSIQDRERRKEKAFRWTLKQHLKRQNKKIKNAYLSSSMSMRWIMPIFLLCTALGPWGFSMLSSSPVTRIIAMLGRGCESSLCIWFWFCGAANHFFSRKRDVEKSWEKVCQYVYKYLIVRDEDEFGIEKKTWYLSKDNILRTGLAILMALSYCVFTVFGISRLLSDPSIVGGEKVLAFLFEVAMPWMRPIFIPVCWVLCFCSEALAAAHTAKYYAAEHVPKPKRGYTQQTSGVKKTFCLYGRMSRNCDFRRKSAYRLAKLCATSVALAQTLVFFVSAINVCGYFFTIILIPSAFLTFNAVNRKCVDTGGDFLHALNNRKFFDFDLKGLYPNWFVSDLGGAHRRGSPDASRLMTPSTGSNNKKVTSLIKAVQGEDNDMHGGGCETPPRKISISDQPSPVSVVQDVPRSELRKEDGSDGSDSESTVNGRSLFFTDNGPPLIPRMTGVAVLG
ncbi:MAG: hypothetical protein VX737_04545 [Pseudomonadota bacterium]|nr:hypothetical protein [Pseudomonadota bacterium]